MLPAEIARMATGQMTFLQFSPFENCRQTKNCLHRDVYMSDMQAIPGSSVGTGPARPWAYIVIGEAYQCLNCCGMNSWVTLHEVYTEVRPNFTK